MDVMEAEGPLPLCKAAVRFLRVPSPTSSLAVKVRRRKVRLDWAMS